MRGDFDEDELDEQDGDLPFADDPSETCSGCGAHFDQEHAEHCPHYDDDDEDTGDGM